MARIFFIHDYSSSRIWLYSAFADQTGALAAANIVPGMFSEWSCEPVKSHNTLWEDMYEPTLPPWYIMGQLEQIKASIEAGRDILLYAEPMRVRQLDFFWRILADYLDITKHEFRAIFIIGHPVAIIENHCREFSLRPGANPGGMARRIAVFPAFIENYCERLGRKNCAFIANPQADAFSAPPRALFEQASSFLGAALEPPCEPPRHPLGYRSHFSRRLETALEVRENAWPPIDVLETRACLLKLDATLAEDFLSPLAGRKAFADGSLQAEFEHICGSLPGSLAAPEKFFTEKEADRAAPLPASEWSAMLAPESRRVLHLRLRNDACLLDADQRGLLKALEDSGEGGFAEIAAPDVKPLVTVLTMTYNQEKFIKKCMDSVLAQQTSFPVQHIVLDHHSTDGTARIVAEYAQRYPSVRPVLLSQRREHENVKGLYLRCRSKYAIFCDGDDYFTDPAKLQIQVDYLERRPDLSFCFHPVAAVFDDGSPTRIFPAMHMIPERENDGFELADLVDGNFIQTNSALYRWRFSDGLPDWFRADICLTDWYAHMLHAETGKFGYLPRIMAVYRRHSGAMFAASTVSTVALRRKMGLAELIAIEACIDHFDKRYHPNFVGLACRVLKDFSAIAAEEGDRSLLDFALKRFPLFAKEFAACQ